MCPARPKWLGGLAIALTLLMGGTAARAQDPVAEAFCALYSPGEVRQILDTKVSAEPGSQGCTWTGTGRNIATSLSAGWTETTIADQKAAWPDGTDLTIGGRTAYFSPGMFLQELFVELDAGMLWLVITGFDGDVEAALTELGELAVPRATSLPPPPQPETPSESHADPSLEALFPESIGGVELDVQSVAGEDAIFDPEDRLAVGEALASLGKTYDDLTGAVVFSEAGAILAYRIVDGDASALLPLLVGVMAEDAALSDAQVGGKAVTLIGADTPFYAYPSGEVLWLVQAGEPALTQILEGLP
jgi:hypothetical protein